MSKLQTDEKRDLQYKANRELIWGIGLLLMGNQVAFSVGETWITTMLGILGVISLGMSLYYNWKIDR
ncbi:hypothetical protein LCGC14_1852130 [marine sediment metagenome]|uniref:Uncharacterized protein n=1 Tax=marine sediment metagenome TaxID=412755 RepID=A0A0F9GY87_9ZZZZ